MYSSWIHVAALFVSEAAADNPLSLGMLAQYGVLGVVSAGLIIFAKGAYKRETDRSDRLEAEVIRLNNMIVDRVIPALTSSANAVEDATELLQGVQREREIALLRGVAISPDRRIREDLP